MSRKVRCTIVDDDATSVDALKHLLLKYPSIEIEEIFTNPADFLQKVSTLKSLVFFLDIQMPDISGIELAERLKGKTVIFVSGHTEYAIQAFGLEVLDFVEKPIEETRLAQAVARINKKFNTISDFVFLPTVSGDKRVKYSDIICITTSSIDSRDKDLYLTNRDKPITIKTKSLDELKNLLNPELFFIIRKGCMVNLKHVMSKSNQRHIEISPTLNGKPIQEEVSEMYWKEFLLLSEIV